MIRGLYGVVAPPKCGQTMIMNIGNQRPGWSWVSPSDVTRIIQSLQSGTINNPSNFAHQSFMLFDEDMTTESDMAMVEWAVNGRLKQQAKSRVHVVANCRDWAGDVRVAKAIWPGFKLIVPMRSIYDIVACVIAADDQVPVLQMYSAAYRTVRSRVLHELSMEGSIGPALIGVNNLYESGEECALPVKYENWARGPECAEAQWRIIWRHLGRSYFKDHDFTKVASSTFESDAIIGGKFKHTYDGTIAVGPVKTGVWKGIPFLRDHLRQIIDLPEMDHAKRYQQHWESIADLEV